MAPMKRLHESSAKNRDKTKRRKCTSDKDMLYKCLGKLCGEECEQDLIPVVDNLSRCHDSPDDVEMDVGMDLSEDDLDNRAVPSSEQLKGIRHLKSKKRTDLTFKIGLQKAKRYICEALEFGVQSGYLRLKDSKGQLLKVSSDLLQATNPSKSYNSRSFHNDEMDTLNERKLMRKRQYDSQERYDDNGDLTEVRRNKNVKKQRSRSGPASKRRSGKSRSRSRRNHGKKRMGRSHSNNPEPEARPKQTKVEETEQHELGSNNKQASVSNEHNEDENDDCKSIKSSKSTKSTPNSETQNTTEEKHGEDDASNDDVSDDDDDKKK